MEDICRLCCSTKFVNNAIFDDENALFIKMSLYLPIKVFKNDRLPQKVCDKCSCKVNDIYQFCNESIEVQNKLRAALLLSNTDPSESIDLTYMSDIKIQSTSPYLLRCEQATQTDWHLHLDNKANNLNPDYSVQVKTEPMPLSPPVKSEENHEDTQYNNSHFDDTQETFVPSDESDNLLLIDVKRTKRKSKKSKNIENGAKKSRKRKPKNLEELVNVISDGSSLKIEDYKMLKFTDADAREVELKEMGLDKKIKTENEDPFTCCICFMQFSAKDEILKHYRQHRDVPAPPRAAPPPAPAPAADSLKCPRCCKKLEASEWSAHWQRHWQLDHRPYRCSLCEHTFKDPISLFKHGMTHKADEDNPEQEKRFICDQCPKGFFYMRYLLAHRSQAHPAAGQYALRCSLCARGFAHINSLRRHMRVHSGERNFLCNVCGKALSSKEHLKFHIRIHTGHKPNVCKTCGKGFVKKCNLTLHERVHSGEKPHVCPHCGKAFSQRSTLVIHERYHSGARPYTCSLCGRGFVAKGLLSMHLKTTCI